MESRVQDHPVDRLTHVIGLPVFDASHIPLGVVVGRIISGATIDLLVRRRRLFHRSRYLRLEGHRVSGRGPDLVYLPTAAAGRARLELVQDSAPAARSGGDAA